MNPATYPAAGSLSGMTYDEALRARRPQYCPYCTGSHGRLRGQLCPSMLAVEEFAAAAANWCVTPVQILPTEGQTPETLAIHNEQQLGLIQRYESLIDTARKTGNKLRDPSLPTDKREALIRSLGEITEQMNEHNKLIQKLRRSFFERIRMALNDQDTPEQHLAKQAEAGATTPPSPVVKAGP